MRHCSLLTSVLFVLHLGECLSTLRAEESSILNAIIDDYAAKYRRIDSLRIDYDWSIEPLISEEALFREKRMMPQPPVSIRVIYHSDGRTYLRSDDPSQEFMDPLFKKLIPEFPALEDDADRLFRDVPFARVRDVINELMADPPVHDCRVVVFDGKRLMNFGELATFVVGDNPRRTFVIVNVDRLHGSIIPPNLIDSLLFAFAMPGLPKESETREFNRFPDALSGPAVSILKTSEEVVDGVRCIAIETSVESRGQRFYFDPALRHTLRKRQWMRKGSLTFEAEYSDFEEVIEHVWLPRSVIETQYAGKDLLNGSYNGRPIFRRRNLVKLLRANDPADIALLSVDFPAGSVVSDQTLTALDRSGQEKALPEPIKQNLKYGQIVPSVSYVQPADRADLEKVVRDAQRQSGRIGENPFDDKPKHSGVVRWLVAVNLGILVFIVGVIAYRRVRARNS